MEGKNLLKGFSKFGESKIIEEEKAMIYVRNDEKITVEIREVVRIKPQDFSALKASFEDWAKTWD